MRILLSNDDGYFSPGIAILAETLSEIGTVTVSRRSATAAALRTR